MSWDDYAADYQALIREREVEGSSKPRHWMVSTCSVVKPRCHCHRRLAAEFLSAATRCGVDIIHL